jgi:hypothetical protein
MCALSEYGGRIYIEGSLDIEVWLIAGEITHLY